MMILRANGTSERMGFIENKDILIDKKVKNQEIYNIKKSD